MKPVNVLILLLLLAACSKQETTDAVIQDQPLLGIDSGNFIVIDSVYHYRDRAKGYFDCRIESFDHGNFTVLTVNWQNTSDSTFSGILLQDGGVDRRMMLSLKRDGKDETYVCQGAKFTRTTANFYYPFIYSGVKMYYTASKSITAPPTDSSRFIVVSGLVNCR